MKRILYFFMVICVYSAMYAQNLTMKAAEATILSGISDDSIKSNDLDSADLRHRQVILDYIEQIRTAYALKDIDFLNQVFYDNDSVLGNATGSIHYIKNSKKQYIEILRRVFQREDHIKVHFDDIEVIRHPMKPFYGVTVLHGWTSGNYHDEGYLFMLWDFTDEKAPQIHVRTWQPSMINGKPLPKDDIFSLSDFDI